MVFVRNIGDKMYATIINDEGVIPPEQNLIIGKAGYGKTMATETFMEAYHDEGYTVIVIADPKDEIELGYAMAAPEEKYHQRLAIHEGYGLRKKPVELYHPFTFGLPKTKLPPFNLFTFSIKDLGRNEWSLLAETGSDTDTIKLLLNASRSVGNDAGIYSFMHYIQELIVGKKEKRSIKPDPKNFYLSVTGGTAKSMQDIANYVQPFKEDFFLAEHNCELNLDWKKIFSSQESYHVFTNKYLRDEKLKHFVIMTLLNQIIKHKDHAKTPILVVIPEVRFLTPRNPKGYKEFLAMAVKDSLSRMRSMGKGMSSILDSQVYMDIDESVANSSTSLLLGELGGVKDIEKLVKALGYSKRERQLLRHQDLRNTYLIKGYEGQGAIRIHAPTHCHGEPKYRFVEWFNKKYPELSKSFKEEIEERRKALEREEEKFKKRVERVEEEKRKAEEEAEKEAEEKKDTAEIKKVEEKLEKATRKEEQAKLKIQQLIYQKKQENPKVSWRKIAKELSLKHHTTPKKYYQQYVKLLEKQQEVQDSESYEEDILKELESE